MVWWFPGVPSSPVRSLRSRPFRWYCLGQGLSVVGSWVQQVALAWVIYRNTGSATLLGVATFCALFPQLVIAPFAGALVDRAEKRKWAMGVELLLAMQAFTLAGLALAQALSPAAIIGMSLAMGVLNSFDSPLRQSLIGSFVEPREDLPNALALNAGLFNLGRFLGPPIAGLLLATTTEAICFLFNGLSFLLLAGVFFFAPGETTPRAQGKAADVLVEGLRFACRDRYVRRQLVLLMAVNLTASSYAVLLPILARDEFAGGPATLGWLWGAVGSGAFVATLYLSSILSFARLGWSAIAGSALAAFGIVSFSATRFFPLALAEMVLLGFGIAICNVGVNILLQSTTPVALRARMISLFVSARFGFDALGGLIAGAAAARFGARPTLAAEGGLLTIFLVYIVVACWRLTAREHG
jgi:hypothetical protein